MIRLTMRYWIWLVVAMWLGAAYGQDFVPKGPQRPKAHVIDEARIFASEPGRLAALESRLAALEEKQRFPLYVVIYDTLIATDVGERSQQLQNDWIGSDPGLVAVMESDSGNISLGIHPVKQLKLDESGATVPDLGPLDLSLLDQNTVSRTIQDRCRGVADSRQRAELLVNTFADEVDRNLEARKVPASSAARIRVIAITVGLFAICGLIGLLAVAWLRRSENRARQRYVFPDITVGTRLGAQYGGGKVSSRDFSGSPDSRRP